MNVVPSESKQVQVCESGIAPTGELLRDVAAPGRIGGAEVDSQLMSVLWLAAGVILIVLGLAGLLLPLLPGMPLVFLGALAIAAADGFTRVGYLSLALIGRASCRERV